WESRWFERAGWRSAGERCSARRCLGSRRLGRGRLGWNDPAATRGDLAAWDRHLCAFDHHPVAGCEAATNHAQPSLDDRPELDLLGRYGAVAADHEQQLAGLVGLHRAIGNE